MAFVFVDEEQEATVPAAGGDGGRFVFEDDEPEGPVIRQGQTPGFLDRVFDSFKDPAKERAKAVQALVDSEALGILPSDAYRYRNAIDAGVKMNQNAIEASRRTNAMDRVVQSWNTGVKQLHLGLAGGDYVLTGDQKHYEAMGKIELPTEDETFVSEGRLEDAFRAAAKMTPIMLHISKESLEKGLPVGMGAGLAMFILGQAGPQAALPEELVTVPIATAAGLKTGMQAAAFHSALKMEAGLSMAGIMQFKDENGNQIDPDIARAAAFGVGAINAGLEVSQIKLLLKTIPGIDKVLGRAVMETVTSKAVKDKLLAVAVSYAGTVAKETGQEVAQESTNIVFEELAKNLNNAVHGTDIDPAKVDDVIDRLYETAKESVQAFAVMAAPGNVIKSGMAGRKEAKTGGKEHPPTFQVVAGGGQAGSPSTPSGSPLIIGVNESPDGRVSSFTMADPISGETFEVGAVWSEDKNDKIRIVPDMEAVAAKVQELRKSPAVEIDALLDRLIQGEEDIDAAAGQMFGETGQGEKNPVQNPGHEGVTTLDDTYAQAREVQPAVLDITKKVADIYGAHVLTRKGDGLKAIESATRKLSDADISGNPSLITDIVGTTIALEDKTIIDAALNDLASAVEEAGGEVVSVNDKFQKEQKDGYKDVNVKIRMPNGHVVEIQLHDAKMLEAKELLGHDIYNVTREIDSIAREKSDSRLFKLGKDLKAQSKKYYALVSEGAEDAARLSASLSEITAASLVILEKLRGLEISSSFSPDILNNLTASLSNLKGIPSFSKYSKRDIIQPPDTSNLAPDGQKVNEDQPSIIKRINDTIGEKGSVDLTPLVDLGKTIWTEGHITIESFTKRAQELLGDVWDRVKDQIQKAWEAVKEFNEKLGERGSFSTGKKYDVDEVNELLGMAARQDQHTGPLPEQPSYDQVRQKAAEMAFEQLQKKIDFQKRKQSAALKRQGKDDARLLPVFQAMEYIANSGGLNQAILAKDYGKETIGELTKRRVGLVRENGTLEIDVVADQVGFDSGDALVNDILDWRGLDAEAERMADQFQQTYGELITSTERDNFHELLIAEEDKIMKSLTAENRPKPAKGLKNFIRQKTGQAKPQDKKVTEMSALNEAFKQAAKAARIAHRAGKAEELQASKERMKWLYRRQNNLRNVRDYFGMTDSQMRKVSQKNPVFMSNYEFSNYLQDVRMKAALTRENTQAKSALLKTIEEKRLQKVDNYRRALALPSINEMTTQQLREFEKLLEPFTEGDVFLTQRELETVDRTDLKGIRTWREARERLAQDAGVELKDLASVMTKWTDHFKWDSALMEKDPFFRLLVGDMTTAELAAGMRVHEIETTVYELAKKADQSRKRTIKESLIPQDEQIMAWLEAPQAEKAAIAQTMTGEQLDYAHYMLQYFADALDYLIATKAVDKGRENYFVHIRKTFLENATEKGLKTAISEVFQQYQQDQVGFNILDDNTGNILPLEKFFAHALQRTGELDPTKNATRAFLTYVRTFERKKMFDAIIPKLDIYTQALTPTVYTPRGLEMDQSIKKFVNKWINNKKGRRISFDSTLRQGGPLDVTIRGTRTFVTMLDLGFAIPVGAASIIGEQSATLVLLGPKAMATGVARMRTGQGKAIIEKYRSFVGRSFWENLTAPGKQANERITSVMFGLFHAATVTANKECLLGMMTESEFRAGELSAERLAEMRLEIGRFRVVPGTGSLVGATSVGDMLTQYKKWAIPFTRSLALDAVRMVKDLKNEPAGEALTTKEAKELYRFVGLTTVVVVAMTLAGGDDDEDRSTFIGDLKFRAWREANTLLQGFDLPLWLSPPRVMTWLEKMAKALHAIYTLETYKATGEMKGDDLLLKELTPGAVRQFGKEDKKAARLQ